LGNFSAAIYVPSLRPKTDEGCEAENDWSPMPNWCSTVSGATGRLGRNLCGGTYGAFPTWLTSVTRNLLVDHYRRTRRDRITDSIDDAMPQLEEKHSSARSPDKLAEAGELSVQLQHALSRLSPELREAVILRDLQSLEYNEIQTVLQVPEGTVKSRINRGRIELARILDEMGLRPH